MEKMPAPKITGFEVNLRTGRGGQDADKLGDGARCHAKQDQRAAPRLVGHDFLHHLARTPGQNFARAGFSPIPAVRRDRKWFIPDHLRPDTARQPKQSQPTPRRLA